MTYIVLFQVYVFTDSGPITIGGERQDVEPGTVKWNIDLKDWEWCDPCSHGNTDVTGKYVDFTIAINGRSGSSNHVANEAEDTINYDLADSSELKLSKKVSAQF